MKPRCAYRAGVLRKKPTNLTLSDAIRDRAARIMAMQGFTSFSAFVEQLIRDEHSRQFAPRPGTLPMPEPAPAGALRDNPDPGQVEHVAKKQIAGIVEAHYGRARKPRKTGKSS